MPAEKLLQRVFRPCPGEQVFLAPADAFIIINRDRVVVQSGSGRAALLPADVGQPVVAQVDLGVAERLGKASEGLGFRARPVAVPEAGPVSPAGQPEVVGGKGQPEAGQTVFDGVDMVGGFVKEAGAVRLGGRDEGGG